MAGGGEAPLGIFFAKRKPPGTGADVVLRVGPWLPQLQLVIIRGIRDSGEISRGLNTFFWGVAGGFLGSFPVFGRGCEQLLGPGRGIIAFAWFFTFDPCGGDVQRFLARRAAIDGKLCCLLSDVRSNVHSFRAPPWSLGCPCCGVLPQQGGGGCSLNVEEGISKLKLEDLAWIDISFGLIQARMLIW